jgi:two-component system, NtrC family, response regulator AtoC
MAGRRKVRWYDNCGTEGAGLCRFERGDAMSRVRGRSILLIEDSEDVARLLVELLRPLGVKVEVAVDAAAALSMARSVQPDLILTDLRLPDMDGLAAVRAIKDDTPALARTPVVVLTGHASPENIREAVDLGVVDFLIKPTFLSKAGLERIRRALESAPPRTERRSASGLST